MKSEFKAFKPGGIEMELTVRMPLAKWIELNNRIDDKHPGWEFKGKISDMINAAKKHFYPNDKD